MSKIMVYITVVRVTIGRRVSSEENFNDGAMNVCSGVVILHSGALSIQVSFLQ